MFIGWKKKNKKNKHHYKTNRSFTIYSESKTYPLYVTSVARDFVIEKGQN